MNKKFKICRNIVFLSDSDRSLEFLWNCFGLLTNICLYGLSTCFVQNYIYNTFKHVCCHHDEFSYCWLRTSKNKYATNFLPISMFMASKHIPTTKNRKHTKWTNIKLVIFFLKVFFSASHGFFKIGLGMKNSYWQTLLFILLNILWPCVYILICAPAKWNLPNFFWVIRQRSSPGITSF